MAEKRSLIKYKLSIFQSYEKFYKTSAQNFVFSPNYISFSLSLSLFISLSLPSSLSLSFPSYILILVYNLLDYKWF